MIRRESAALRRRWSQEMWVKSLHPHDDVTWDMLLRYTPEALACTACEGHIDKFSLPSYMRSQHNYAAAARLC